MDHQPRPGVRAEKGARDRLIRLAASHPEWVLGYQDEVWWSRLARPGLHAWAGAEPFLLSLFYRGAGAIMGVLFIQRIKGKDLRKRHYYFSRFLPVAIPVYLLLVMFVSGILSSQWWTLDEATNALEPRQFLPFWNFYIVSKAHAAQSLVVTAMIYAPIGVMVWLRRGFWSSHCRFQWRAGRGCQPHGSR